MPGPPIGLIGCGLLGTALAERMLAGGCDLVGFDRDPAALGRLARLGGTIAASPSEIASRYQVIVLCLPDSQIVTGVLDQLGDKLTPGTLLIDATTGDPDDTEALAERLARRGIAYADATIAGSSEQARRGEATVMIGCLTEDLARANTVLKTWSEKRHHIGPPGSGARLKLVVNLVLGLNRAVLAEGLSLAGACGMDPAAALEVLKTTPAYSAAMESKGPKMVQGDFAPVARLAQHLKDVRLIRALAQRHAAQTPLSDVHEELLQRAVELGLGDADNSAIIRAFSAPRPQPSPPPT